MSKKREQAVEKTNKGMFSFTISHEDKDTLEKFRHGIIMGNEIPHLTFDAIEQRPKFSEDLEKAITEFAEAIYNFTKVGAMNIEGIKGTLESFILANGLVQLADQALPHDADKEFWGEDEEFREGYKISQRDMTTPKGGCVWRRVKE